MIAERPKGRKSSLYLHKMQTSPEDASALPHKPQLGHAFTRKGTRIDDRYNLEPCGYTIHGDRLRTVDQGRHSWMRDKGFLERRMPPSWDAE